MRVKLTKRVVDATKPADRDAFAWDTELKGFGLKVTPAGAKTFVVQYYAPGLHRVTRRAVIGPYGALTTEDARAKAQKLLAAIAEERDPSREKAEARRAAREDTVERLLPSYLEDGVGRKSVRTLAFYESLGKLHILPAIGKLPVNQVTAKEVAELHRSLRDKPTTANRVVRLVKSFFHWLAKPSNGSFGGVNPAKHIEWFPEHARERFLTAAEVTRLGQALRTAETVGLPPDPKHRKAPREKRARNSGMFTAESQVANPVAVAALRFLMLSGWREQEVLTLKWSFVDLAKDFVTLPDTKTGRSVRTLSIPMRDVLTAQPRVVGSAYVFPGRDPQKPLREVQRLWYAARRDAALEDVRLHDLRHSVASFAGGQGYSLFLIGKLLGHKDARSTARYAHLADDIRKTMADDVGETIRAAMESGSDDIRLTLTNEAG